MRLYKFYGAESALRNIRDRRLKISTIHDLNDPFEFNAIKLPNKASRTLWSTQVNRIFREIGIVCFCRSWDNPVIWSHYADSHRGLALGFDVLSEGELLPVEYTKSRIDFAQESERSFNGDTFGFIKKSIATKFIHWEYENEVRLVVDLGKPDQENGLFFKKFDDELILREVIIGAKSEVSSLDIRNAFGANTPLETTTARLAFQDFRVVRQHAKRLQK
ncbi:DUF2971 domain-containing protein [Leisingera sp. McT4-56]|uniref:DUF2971 domain-containing protein n=1 Tax=Leisingera sp. McT4-56 TaxID=2881255 RepID=UPI001CF8276D|nr:DUF2971 domain-containing protein [Leisingera sp. McT4-56]MCB4455125.1 DUF2971 domain-containing protein [Leisingera sp. McT4-56]